MEIIQRLEAGSFVRKHSEDGAKRTEPWNWNTRAQTKCQI